MDDEDCENSPHELIMKNVFDLRKRLKETEKTLKTISKLETQMTHTAKEIKHLPDESTASRGNVDDIPAIMFGDLHRNPSPLEDDRFSVGSGRSSSTLRSSFMENKLPQLPSSTPIQKGGRVPNRFETREEEQIGDHNQVHVLKKSNHKILTQNHRLISEIESLTAELQISRAKVKQASSELEDYRALVPELHERIQGAESEVRAQDALLRDAEERYESCQRHVVKLEAVLAELRLRAEDASLEADKERVMRKSVETQRDESLQSFIDLQDTFEDYQRKTKAKLKKRDDSEDYLQDNLEHANLERQDLLERVAAMQATIHGHEEAIRRLEEFGEVEQDSKTDVEQENRELRSHVTRLKSVVGRLESDANQTDCIARENSRLKLEVERQQAQLNVCQQEIEESRSMLVQLEQLAQQVQHQTSRGSFANDSGVSSVPQAYASVSFYKPDTTDEGGGPNALNSATAQSLVSDLRMKIARKDSEIQRLQKSLQSSESSSHDEREAMSALISSLQGELQSMQQTSAKGQYRNSDLENLVSSLESERAKMSADSSEFRRQINDLETQTSSLESHLNQRNKQLIELQEEINKKCADITNMEREVRRKTAHVANLEEQLDEKGTEFSSHILRLKGFEAEMTHKDSELHAVRRELSETLHKEQEVSQKLVQNKLIHQEQCGELERQIEIFQSRLDTRNSKMSQLEKEMMALKEEVSSKTSHLVTVERSLQQANFELQAKTKSSHEILAQLEKQTTEGTSHIRQLQSALGVCKQEIRSYVDTLDDTKDQFDRELTIRDEKIATMKRKLQQAYMDIDEKSQEAIDMESSIQERQLMLQQSTARIADLEETQTEMEKQISKLEQHQLVERTRFIQESHTLEKKLHLACADLQHRTNEITHLTQSVRELQNERKQTRDELSTLDAQLQQAVQENETGSARITKLEKDGRDLRVHLEQKIEIATEFEDNFYAQEEDLRQRNDHVNELESKLEQQQISMQKSETLMTELRHNVQKAEYESRGKDQLLDDMKDMMRRTQDELNDQKQEADDLRDALEDRQRDLQQRVDQVSKLDKAIRSHQSDTQKKFKTLEESLLLSQSEVLERSKQVADLDDRLQATLVQLREKSLLLQQTDQIAQHQRTELDGKTARLDALEKSLESHKQRLDEQRGENVEINQELRLTREQLQLQHTDNVSLKRECGHAQREQDRLARELEEAMVTMQNKDIGNGNLLKELKMVQARETETETAINDEIKSIEQRMDRLTEEHQAEVKKLKSQNAALAIETREQLAAEIQQKSAEFEDRESQYHVRMQQLKEEVAEMGSELQARKDLVEAANEAGVIKDSEIARLHAKLSGYDRALSLHAAQLSTTSQMHPSWVSTMMTQGNQPVPVDPMPMANIANSMKQNVVDQSHYSVQRPQDLTSMNGSIVNDLPPRNVELSFPTSKNSHFKPIRDDASEISAIGPASDTISVPGTFQGLLQNSSNIFDASKVKPTAVRTLNFSETTDNSTESKENIAPTGQFLQYLLQQQSIDSASLLQQGDRQMMDRVTVQSAIPGFKPSADKLQPGRPSDGYYNPHQFEPRTAVEMFQSTPAKYPLSDNQGRESLLELQQRLRENELRQQAIDRQLQSLNEEENSQK